MATPGLVLFTSLSLLASPPVLTADKTPEIPAATAEKRADDGKAVPEACLDPARVFEGCVLSSELYYQSKEWEKRARKTYVDLEACDEKLRKAEEALKNKTEAPEPSGWNLSPVVVIGGVTVTVGAAALVTYLLVK